MDRKEMIYGRVYKAFLTYMDRETKKEKTRFLGGFPYETDPHNVHYEIPTAVNLGAEFVLQTMNGNGPVPEAIEAVKMYLKTLHFTKQKDLPENTESFLFKTMFCAPTKYVKTVLDAGLDINAVRCHPIYTDIKDYEAYPMLVYAAEIGDSEKVKALLENGADKSFGATAAVLCAESTFATPAQKIACFKQLNNNGVDLLQDDVLNRITPKEKEVFIWLQEAKRGYEVSRKISHHSKKEKVAEVLTEKTR